MRMGVVTEGGELSSVDSVFDEAEGKQETADRNLPPMNTARRSRNQKHGGDFTAEAQERENQTVAKTRKRETERSSWRKIFAARPELGG
jgi:hypothetical protein